VILFQVLDPAERTFQFRNASLFQDLETQREIYIDPDATRAAYQQKLEAHNGAVRQVCERHGIQYNLLPSDQPMEFALFDFLRSRMQRNRVVRRRTLR
jgi:hypothetical protein